MRNFYLFIFGLFAACCLYACQKDSKGNSIVLANDTQNMLVGTWNLKQQHTVQYIDGTKDIDTIYNASSNSHASSRFSSNNTFVSTSFFINNSNGYNLNGGAVFAADSTSGTYSIAGSKFSLSAPIAGFVSGGGAVFGTTSGTVAPVITPVSNSVSITHITSTQLQLHTEYVYTYTANNVSQTYKTDNDYYFTR